VIHANEHSLNEATLATIDARAASIGIDRSVNWQLKIILHLIIVLLRRLVEYQEANRESTATHKAPKRKSK